MEPDIRFRHLPKEFWANVRLIGQDVGYTDRGQKQVLVPSLSKINEAFGKRKLGIAHLVDRTGQMTTLGDRLAEYFEYRARMLNTIVEPNLMDGQEAKHEFERLHSALAPSCPIPMNKQTGDKKAPAYFTGLVNMLIEAHSGGLPCDYDPRSLTLIANDGAPVRTLARRVDGAFTSVFNPIAVWEIKEYYYTTTFGSRVADGIYETLLDGIELEEAREAAGIHIEHLLMVDSHYTWWECGKSYLCRMIDMLHMGYVDEVLFGREVLSRLPVIVQNWVKTVNERGGSA